MPIIRRIVAGFPTLVGAGMLAVCAGMLIVNMVSGLVAHARPIELSSYPVFGALAGVTERLEKRPLNLHTLFDGSFQRDYARIIGTRLPVFAFAVRLRNQVEFSMLHTSATPSIVVGAGRELVEPAYLNDYCSRNLAAFLPGAREWARRIRDMQDMVEARHQTFLYVLTPSKVAQYPEFIPAGMPCPSTPRDRAAIVPAWLALVRAAGVHVVDTTAIIAQAHGKYPFALFPVGGTHWNSVAGALAGQAIAAGLAVQRRDGIVRPLDFTWRLDDEPSGVDIDLATLMNLLWMPVQQPVPDVTTQPQKGPAGCRPLSAVIIGGSFSHAIGETFSEQPCDPKVTEYEYWHNFELTWREAEVDIVPFSAAQRDRDLRDADIVIYEENEQLLGHSKHGKALYDYLVDHKS
jgi:alginate O-acetyltransferase complex protein AlgJ